MAIMRNYSLAVIAIVIVVAVIILYPKLTFKNHIDNSHVVNNSFDLPFNNEGRLFHDILLYQDNAACAEVAAVISRSDIHIRETRAISNSLYEEIFGRSASNSKCSLACLDMGSPARYVTRIIKEKQYHFSDNTTESSVNVHDWYNDVCEMKEVGFAAAVEPQQQFRPFSIYFLENGVNRILIQHHNPEDSERSIWLESHIGHKFEIVDTETELSLGIYEVTHDAFYVIGQYYSGINPDTIMSFRHKFFTFYRHWTGHAVVKRTFTELGFLRGRLPPDLFNYLSTYYYNNQYQYLLEEGHNFGLGTNYWEQDSHVIDIPFRIKRYWQRRLMPLVEAWSNTTLSLTSIYGMRRYHEGARLFTHIDKTVTHAVSLIINIAQNHLSEPWKVEIYDHAERLHEIEMEEGDIIYYESAKCLHGRMRALRGSGSYYVNLFAHYMPVDDNEWFEKETPVDFPQPLFNLDGVDIPSVLPYLSPRNKQLTGPEDLLDYWVQTGGTSHPMEDPLASAYIIGRFPNIEDVDISVG